MGFVKYCAYNNIIREQLLKKGKKVSVGSKVVLHVIDYYEKTVRDLLKDTLIKIEEGLNPLALTNILELKYLKLDIKIILSVVSLGLAPFIMQASESVISKGRET